MALSKPQFRILAQPQQSHRERYTSELDPRRNRPNRFIRAEPNEYNFDYPTVEVSSQWNRQKNYYVRVTLATVPIEQAQQVICVHPYSIDAEETAENVIKDTIRNTLFFPITDEDFNRGHKSFRITRKKSVQHELRNYGRLRVLDTDQEDMQRLDDQTDARKLIEIYQLGKSQLVFSLAELVAGHQLPVIYGVTTIFSNVMVAMPTAPSLNNDDSVRCAPRRSSWEGGAEVLMVLPRLDRRRSVHLIFEQLAASNVERIPVEIVDTRTISFFAPPCPVQFTGQQNVEIPLIVRQGEEEIARINFLYGSFGQHLIDNQQPIPMEQYFDDENAPDDTLFY